MKYIDTVDVRQRIADLQDYLDSNIRSIEDEVGWHQHLGARKVGIVASAIGLLLHKRLSSSFEKEQDVLTTLLKRQNQDGGWPYISNSQNQSNVEATCWALLALHSYNDNGRYKEVISKGKEWLLNQNPSGNEDYGWPFRKNGDCRVYITCFALKTLSMIGAKGNSKVESAIHWLINIQNEDGGWGEAKGNQPSIFFTSYALLSLLEIADERHNFLEAINKGKNWLEAKMKDLSLESSHLTCQLELIETETRNNKYRIYFFHYVLPFVLLCYVKLGIQNKVFFDSIKLLLNRSKGGVVEHPMLDSSKKRPIWALYGVAVALSSVIPDNGKNKLIFVFWNRLHKFSRNWLNKALLSLANNWVVSIAIITFFIYFGAAIIAQYWDVIHQYLIGYVSPNWANLCMSIGASIIATVLANVISVLKKKILS